MKKIPLIIFISILFSMAVNAQDFIVEEENIIGEWIAKIPADRSSSMDMLFEGSSIIIHNDFSFVANLMEEFKGTWSLSENTAILKSDTAPDDIVLAFKEDGSCVWNFSPKGEIPFFKKSSKE